ncbi:MAG: hypothetical protein J6S76_07530 [Clostridia bacterium]|nr:hypothetical protein [Clostridia bacterium]
MFKKISAGVIACLMLGALAANTNAILSDKTATAPGVANGSINVADGTTLDAGYGTTSIPLVEFNDQRGYSDHETYGKFWTAFDADYLYVYVEVTDPDIDYSGAQDHMKDSVAILIDFDYNRTENYPYGDNPNNRVGYLNLTGQGSYVSYHIYNGEARPEYADLAAMVKYSAVADTGDGRILYEFALPFPDDFEVVEGAKFGLEVQINACGDQQRLGMTTWSYDGSNNWRWSDCAGTMILGAPYVEPDEPTDDPTDDPTDEPTDEPTDTPVTADAGLVAAAALMAVAAGVVLSKKRG